MAADLAIPTAPSTQWARQRDEREDEHAAFTQWLALAPRPAPSECGPGVGELAARQDWLSRAQAYDTACELLRRVPDLNPNGLIRDAVTSWALLTAVTSDKLVKAAMASKTPTVANTELLSFMNKFLELGTQFAQRDEELNADALTPEELEQYLRLTAKLEKK